LEKDYEEVELESAVVDEIGVLDDLGCIVPCLALVLLFDCVRGAARDLLIYDHIYDNSFT